MNILFLTLSTIRDMGEHDIYQDLCRCLAAKGHRVYVLTPAEDEQEVILQSHGCTVLCVRTGRQSGGSLIRKGISTLRLPGQYEAAIKAHLDGIRFDLVLYSTPPITLLPVIGRLKKRFGCRTYLMLKDIFPQNAVDLRMFGAHSPIYHWFRMQERQLYALSDTIGCMSPANRDYILQHNSLDPERVELCPNALEPRDIPPLTQEEKQDLRRTFGIPDDALVFVYGGNLGAPQGIEYMARCLEKVRTDRRVFFLIVGSGSAAGQLEQRIRELALDNVHLVGRLNREEYFRVMRMGDVGMVFLDPRFTIPNFPSRILPYMESSMPVLCVTDRATDVGRIARENGFGWFAPSDSPDQFREIIDVVCRSDLKSMGAAARRCLEEQYHVQRCCTAILREAEGEDVHE